MDEPSYLQLLNSLSSERLRVLYAPFRPKEWNPEAWNAKRTFLKSLVRSYLDHTGLVRFALEQLQSDLTFGGVKPEGLEEIVVEVASSEKDLSDRLEGRWLGRGWRWMWGGGGQDERWVDQDNLEKKVNAIVDRLNEEEELCIGEAKMKKLSEINKGNEADWDLCELLGRKEAKFVVKGDYVKVPGSEWTEVEEAFVKLTDLKANLESECQRKRRDEAEWMGKVREYCKSGNKALAKTYLQRSKRLGQAIARTETVLNEVEAMRESLRDMEQNKQVMSVYEIGNKALKHQLKEIDANKVKELVNDVRDCIEEAEDIGDAMVGGKEDNEEHKELLKELEAIALVDEIDKLKVYDGNLPANPETNKNREAILN